MPPSQEMGSALPEGEAGLLWAQGEELMCWVPGRPSQGQWEPRRNPSGRVTHEVCIWKAHLSAGQMGDWTSEELSRWETMAGGPQEWQPQGGVQMGWAQGGQSVPVTLIAEPQATGKPWETEGVTLGGQSSVGEAEYGSRLRAAWSLD